MEFKSGFETIADKDLRAKGERRALRLARSFLVDRERFVTIEAVGEAVVAADKSN